MVGRTWFELREDPSDSTNRIITPVTALGHFIHWSRFALTWAGILFASWAWFYHSWWKGIAASAIPLVVSGLGYLLMVKLSSDPTSS